MGQLICSRPQTERLKWQEEDGREILLQDDPRLSALHMQEASIEQAMRSWARVIVPPICARPGHQPLGEAGVVRRRNEVVVLF